MAAFGGRKGRPRQGTAIFAPICLRSALSSTIAAIVAFVASSPAHPPSRFGFAHQPISAGNPFFSNFRIAGTSSARSVAPSCPTSRVRM